MGARVMKNTRVYVGGADYSGQSNSTSLAMSAAEHDSTTYDSEGAEEVTAGLSKAAFSVAGRWNAGDAMADEDGQAHIGAIADVVSLVPESGAEGDRAFSARVCLLNYSAGGDVGGLIDFSLDGRSDGVMFRGDVVKSARDTETVDGDGTAFELGALEVGERMFAALHILDVTGELAVTVESSDDEAFTEPLMQAEFAATSEAGAQWRNVAGPLTDPWWRVTWTLTGADPSARFAVVAGRR